MSLSFERTAATPAASQKVRPVTHTFANRTPAPADIATDGACAATNGSPSVASADRRCFTGARPARGRARPPAGERASAVDLRQRAAATVAHLLPRYVAQRPHELLVHL